MYEEKILIGTDTISGISPQILDAISEASNTNTLPYGNDVFTEECKINVENIFEKSDLEIIPMVSGTASNSLALSSFMRSYGSIICHVMHILIKMKGERQSFFLVVANY